MPEYVVNAEEYVQNALTTKFGDTGDTLKRVRGTQLDIQGLIPNRTYLLYLATTNTAGTMCDQVLCYKFTTTPPDPPVITIDPSGTTGATFTVTPSSTLSFVLVSEYLLQPRQQQRVQPGLLGQHAGHHEPAALGLERHRAGRYAPELSGVRQQHL